MQRRIHVQSFALAALASALASMSVEAAIVAQRIATGLSSPVYATAPAGDTRLYLVEQGSSGSAAIKIYDRATQTLNAAPFVTLSGLSTGGERGLLGLAFHPDYANNGYFYVNSTVRTSGQLRTEITRYQANPLTGIADSGSATRVLRFDQPFDNHNGGWLGFGPDGYLYIGSGDGGSGGDPLNAGQRLDTLLGKMLRIDVDADDFGADPDRNYGIPVDNPFAGATPGLDEIWDYGLRNPWRASFDRGTGDLYIGDVGQNAREEVDRHAAGTPGGLNFGWRLREGTIPTPGVGIDPIAEYTHPGGANRSITGGYVYRGPNSDPQLQGKYLYADYITGQIWSLDPVTLVVMELTGLITPDFGSIDNISSFGEDSDGNLYIVDHFDGEIYLLAPVPLPPALALIVPALAVLRSRRRVPAATR